MYRVSPHTLLPPKIFISRDTKVINTKQGFSSVESKCFLSNVKNLLKNVLSKYRVSLWSSFVKRQKTKSIFLQPKQLYIMTVSACNPHIKTFSPRFPQSQVNGGSADLLGGLYAPVALSQHPSEHEQKSSTAISL